MSTASRWKATPSKRQSRNLGLVYALLAVATWVLILLGEPAWWWFVLAVLWSVLSAFYLNSWRRWSRA
ncbi:hypothetical protein [Cryptosporangium japonicum]|uniref:Uncharacterized protein n=1 Tax=Cryptosporangium japonicum TaxID=80872 RepID=A0ABN0U995_9ACTN